MNNRNRIIPSEIPGLEFDVESVRQFQAQMQALDPEFQPAPTLRERIRFELHDAAQCIADIFRTALPRWHISDAEKHHDSHRSIEKDPNATREQKLGGEIINMSEIRAKRQN